MGRHPCTIGGSVALLLASAAGASGGQLAGPSSSAVYVSPGGDDAADGHTPATAFRSLGRVQTALHAGEGDTALLMDGTFRIDAPVTIGDAARPQRWLPAPGAHPVLDGGGRTGQALVVTGRDIVVEGLGIVRFAGNGIVVTGARRVTIRNNHVADIASNAWTTAAILVVQFGRDVLVENNRIENTGYAGIGFFASEGGDLSGVRIVGNRLTNTCRRVADCGAIYVGGRTPTANGAVIRGNRITDYGPPGGETKAVYLDDGVSDASVSGNVIRGTGTYAFQIHGGSGNRIAGNDASLSRGEPILFHQEMEGAGHAMRGNRLDRNTVRGPGVGPPAVKYGGGSRAIVLPGRRLVR